MIIAIELIKPSRKLFARAIAEKLQLSVSQQFVVPIKVASLAGTVKVDTADKAI